CRAEASAKADATCTARRAVATFCESHKISYPRANRIFSDKTYEPRRSGAPASRFGRRPPPRIAAHSFISLPCRSRGSKPGDGDAIHNGLEPIHNEPVRHSRPGHERSTVG